MSPKLLHVSKDKNCVSPKFLPLSSEWQIPNRTCLLEANCIVVYTVSNLLKPIMIYHTFFSNSIWPKYQVYIICVYSCPADKHCTFSYERHRLIYISYLPPSQQYDLSKIIPLSGVRQPSAHFWTTCLGLQVAWCLFHMDIIEFVYLLPKQPNEKALEHEIS